MAGLHPRNVDERVKVFGVLAILVFLLLSVRLWVLQIVRGEVYANLSEGNRIRLIRITAPRGKFLDRNGVPMVASRMAFTISVVPYGLKDPDREAKELSRILGIKEEEIKAKINSPARKPFEPVRLKTDVEPQIVTTIEERRTELPGIMVEEMPVRNYINGEFASHLFGYIGEISQTELASLRERGYRPGDIVGKTGLERVYEEYLHGEDGGEQVEVNNLSRPIRVLGSKEPIPGNDLVLTIDMKVQRAAEEALKEQLEALQKSPDTKNARAGAVVAIDPRSGEILAMASRPGFDPNDFVGGISPERWKELNSPLNPQTNRVTSATYPPGSAFKPITAIAALEEGKVTTSDRFFCPGRDPSSGKACWILASKGRGHGRLDFIQGMAESCNIVFYELGRRAGINSIATYARNFGLGRPTGIQLFPPEKSGLVPDPAWKRENFKGWDKVWYPVETLDVAIGQGALSVTPLQLANAYVAIANGGTLYKPYVVKRILSPEGRVLESFGPEVVGHVALKPETWQVLREALKAVVSSGTASSAFRGFPIPVAGKTGTAQCPPHDSHGWFVGFAPADDPQIVALAFVEHGTSGSLAAAPIVRKVFEAYFGLDEN